MTPKVRSAVVARAATLETSANSRSGSEKVSKAKAHAGPGVEVALLVSQRFPAHRPGRRQPVPPVDGDGAHIGGDDPRRRADVFHFAPPRHARPDAAFLRVVVVESESLRAGGRPTLRLAVEDRIERAEAAEVALDACVQHARIV